MDPIQSFILDGFLIEECMIGEEVEIVTTEEREEDELVPTESLGLGNNAN